MLWLVIHHLQTLGVLKDGSGAGFNSVQLYLNSRSYNMTVLGRKTHTSSMQVHQSAENWPGWRGPGGAQFVVSDPSVADSPQPHPGPSFSRLYIFLLISKGEPLSHGKPWFRFHGPPTTASCPDRSQPTPSERNTDGRKSFLSSLRAFWTGTEEQVPLTWAATGQKNK